MREDAPSLEAAELLMVTQAAQRSRVSRWTIHAWIARGKLPTMLIDRRRRILPADLAATEAMAHVDEVVPAWREDRQRTGRPLRTLREAVAMTQLQLAAASGLTHEAISWLEAGKRAPLPRQCIPCLRAWGLIRRSSPGTTRQV
jgi:DNA-binding XRE family transcriptional regulator